MNQEDSLGILLSRLSQLINSPNSPTPEALQKVFEQGLERIKIDKKYADTVRQLGLDKITDLESDVKTLLTRIKKQAGLDSGIAEHIDEETEPETNLLNYFEVQKILPAIYDKSPEPHPFFEPAQALGILLNAEQQVS